MGGHGIIGTIGGAVAGSLMEDFAKKQKHNHDEKKHDQQMQQQMQQQGWAPPPGYDQGYGGHEGKKDKKGKKGMFGRRGSSSSSSSSDDEKKKWKKAQKHGGAPPPMASHYGGGNGGGGELRGNFSGSARDITLDKDYDLIAYVQDVHGHGRLSSLTLNDCLTNEWGHFKWSREGNFAGSARNIRLADGGRVLEAELNNGGGGWSHAFVRLDERITNDNGNLRFVE